MFDVKNAVEALLKDSQEHPRKFVQSVEFIINTEFKAKDDVLRGCCIVPNDLGKVKKVAIFTEDAAKIKACEDAGADKVGFEDLITDIMTKKIDYDVYLANSAAMPKLKKVAGILGTRGLMPNNKVGTLTDQPEAAVNNMKHKAVFFKSVKGVVQARIGSVANDSNILEENIKCFTKYILDQNKDTNAKKSFIKSIFIKTTMGKVFQINASEFC